MVTKEVRTLCRKQWGKEWWKAHPVMKAARVAWARKELGEKAALDDVHVTEATGEQYIV